MFEKKKQPLADKRTPAAWEVGIYLRRGPVFFEAFGCGASHSNYNLTLKPNAGIHAARIPGARREEARGRCAREGGVSYAFYRFDGLRSFRNACGRVAQRHFARDDNRSPATAGQSGGGQALFHLCRIERLIRRRKQCPQAARRENALQITPAASAYQLSVLT